ncbi:hypothetical protein CN070_04310 [Sinorhizobium meliloti]|nr:hypothetical protein CN070_04310 [Sinorhizobium meliloti]
MGKTVTLCALRPVEIRVTRRRLSDFLIPVLVTGIQPDQVLGLKELFPRRRRGAALNPVTSTGMRESHKRRQVPESQQALGRADLKTS